MGDGFCHIICSVEQFPIIFIVSLGPESFPPNLDDLPVSLAILTLWSLDKRMPRGYTDHREMIRMNENEMLSLILSKLESLEAGQKGMHAEINGMHAEMKEVNRRLDSLENRQKEVNRRLDSLEDGQKAVNRRLDILENGQKDVNRRLDSFEDGQKDMRADMKETNRRLDTLEEGQKTIRRDVARVERKIDRLGNDVGDTLAIVTEATDYEISKLREAK